MLGGTRTDLSVTVLLLFLTQTATRCSAENGFSSVTLPEERTRSEYVTQCFYDGPVDPGCDWTKSQQPAAQDDVTLRVLELGPLGIEGEACLEFWFLPPATANGAELRVWLKSTTGLVDIWASPVLPRDSWRQVFVPLTLSEPGTQVVFEAMGATSSEEQIEVKHIGVRRGSCGPQCESNTEFWTDGSTRCHCAAGQLLCSLSRCPEGQICGSEMGSANAAPTTGMCAVHRHTDCSTFDGALFRFMAPCTYVLAKTCSSAKALPAFSLEVVNEQEGNASLPTVQRIMVDMGDIRVTVLKEQTKRVVVNGVWRKLPLSLANGTVEIQSNPAAIVLTSRFGLSVSFDTVGTIQVTLPPSFSDQVCGLCGNFNHRKDDDFRKPDGTIARSATALAASWQTGKPASSCETITVPHQCDPQEEAEYASEMQCGGLVSSSGPFAGCLSVLGAQSYFRACLVSMCSSEGDPEVLCEILQAYADVCQKAGVAAPAWRNSTSCSLQCGPNSHYNSCADGCPEVCSTHDLAGSCGSCEERCECDPGFKLSGGKCVPAGDCGCWYEGKHYERGETLMTGDCEEHCQCMGNGNMQCTSTQCQTDEVCKVQDGVKGCFPFRPATCSVYGDPHYITFDQWAYDFQGGCSYTLTTTCGEGSAVQFSVIGHNMHPSGQNSSRSKLEAVTLEIGDLPLTLTQQMKVHVNSTKLPLPLSINGAFGSIEVQVKNNHLVLESSFGLRMVLDGRNRLFLQVDERYKYELCGLCGTYSGYQDDDFVTPGGQNVTDAFEFGDSWRIPDIDDCVAYPDDPPLCDSAGTSQAYNVCSAIFEGPFQACHEHIHPSIYLNSCVYDYCATHGDLHTLCESLKSYEAACRVAGVKLPNWEAGTACAEPTTTPTTPPPTTASSPTPDPNTCPLNCNFDKNLCGWQQLVQDSFDWTRHSGPTPSALTGPHQDHTSGAGHYMYLEANSATHGDSARLMSSACHYSGPTCLHFWYHMYGSASAMALNIYWLKDNTATKVWSKMHSQGPEWRPAVVDISESSPFWIIVEGIRGSNDQSDVAIDDVSIHFGTCKERFPGLVSGIFPVSPSPPICSLDCSFDRSLCGWSQMMTDAFDWTLLSGSTPTLMTGPSADHTGGGQYLYIEASNASHGDTARLISSECGHSGPQCLRFWYHMYGSAETMGLHVYLLQNKLADAIFWQRNDQGNAWHLAQVDFQTTGPFQVIFEGRRGSNDQSDVAIDDVKLFHGLCSDLSGDSNTTAPPSGTEPAITTPEPPMFNVTALPPFVNGTEPPPEEATTESNNQSSVTTPSNEKPPAPSDPTNVTTNPSTLNPVTTVPPSIQVPTTTINGTEAPVCQLQCDFEQDLCGWSQLLTDVFDWTRQRGSTPTMLTGPSSDHTTGDGHYLYIEANSATMGDTARLISSECGHSGPQCLQFWYHMRGSADTMGLHVYLYQNRRAEAIWWKRNDQGNAWQLAQVDVAATAAFQIILEGRRGSNEQSDVAIDDVSLHRGPCADLEKPEIPALTTEGSPTGEVTDYPPMNSSTTTKPSVTVPKTTAGIQNTTYPEPQTTPEPQTPTASAPTVSMTSEPQPSSAQTTVEPQPPTTTESHPNMTEGPDLLTTTQPRPQTTAEIQPTTAAPPESQTTTQPPPPTTTQPLPTTTTQPQPTTPTQPPSPTTTQPPPTTTTQPPPTTPTQPRPTTTTQPPPTTTTKPLPPTITQPPPPTTTQPPPSTTTQPPPPTTTQPPPPTTTQPLPPTMTQPPPPTTTQPPPPTTTQPLPMTTQTPPPTMTQPPSPTTTQPLPTTTTQTPPPTTTQHPPSTATQPPPPATTQPPPPTTTQPLPPTMTQPPPPTTTQPPPPTTTQPPPSTTTQPPPPTTTQPPPPTTTQPPPPTTTQPPPPTTTQPPPPTTTQPPPPTTTQPPPPTTTQPPPPTTTQPPPTTTAQHSTTVGTQLPPTTTRKPQTSKPLPSPSCPKNSHYTACVSACRPTCKTLNGPSHCHKSGPCRPGCVCNDGFVQKSNVCVPIRECGCVDSKGNKYQFNEKWYTDHCRQKCECEKDDGRGQIECDDEDECDGNAVCLQDEEGNYYCQSTDFDECSVDRDNEYKTFDKMKYTFEGEHAYILVRTKNLPSNIQDVYIEGVHSDKAHDDEDDDDDDSGSEEDERGRDHSSEEHQEQSHCLQELRIRVYNHTVTIERKRKITVDGQRIETPASPSDGLHIRERSSRIYLTTDFGLSVKFDGHSEAEIILPRIYRSKVGGLCGNFDGRKQNDQMKPDGSKAHSIREFGESWAVRT